jgi:hypothetical protein
MPALTRSRRHVCENHALALCATFLGRESRGYFACALRTAPQRHFVAALTARRPMALSLCFFWRALVVHGARGAGAAPPCPLVFGVNCPAAFVPA